MSRMNEWGYTPPDADIIERRKSRRNHLPGQLQRVRAKYRRLVLEAKELGFDDLLLEHEHSITDTGA